MSEEFLERFEQVLNALLVLVLALSLVVFGASAPKIIADLNDTRALDVKLEGR